MQPAEAEEKNGWEKGEGRAGEEQRPPQKWMVPKYTHIIHIISSFDQ